MKYKVNLIDVNSVDEIEGKWSHNHYVKLLEAFEYEDVGDTTDHDLKELLYMAITDYEPQEAAELILKDQLGNELNDGQIEQISHDMLKENVAEHYSDISFHSRLFDINVLLYKAFNGMFPHAQASVITLEIIPHHDSTVIVDEAIVLRVLAPLIDDHAVFKRLYKDQLAGEDEFEEAQHIVWYFKNIGENRYEIITSDYWINNADFIASTADVNVSVED